MTPADRRHLPTWRVEELRTTLWLVPVGCIVVAALLFVGTYLLDQAAYDKTLQLPWWIRTGSADAGREVLIGIAAAVITVVGLVFSITIVALTLASQQFGPRMLRSFIRDVGTQLTLGIFVGSFVYAVLALGSITNESHGQFVPHISITVAEVLMCVDIAVLIYFIHHVARTIQLPEVIARIARDLGRSIEDAFPEQIGFADVAPGGAGGNAGGGGGSDGRAGGARGGRSLGTGATLMADDDPAGVGRGGGIGRGGGHGTIHDLVDRISAEGVTVPATRSGYLQIVAFGELVDIAERAGGVIHLAHRVGHFMLAGRPLATVWPAEAAPRVAKALTKAHITGPYRTFAQDPVFPIDQLAEIGIRALSPAVNDTFTALTCIDWLAEGLCNISGRRVSEGVFHDRHGDVRLIEIGQSYDRMVNRAFDKVRQSSSGMPAVLIRLVDAISHIIEYTTSSDQRRVLLRQDEMVMRMAEASIREENDLEDIRHRHERLLGIAADLDAGRSVPRRWIGDS